MSVGATVQGWGCQVYSCPQPLSPVILTDLTGSSPFPAGFVGPDPETEPSRKNQGAGRGRGNRLLAGFPGLRIACHCLLHPQL